MQFRDARLDGMKQQNLPKKIAFNSLSINYGHDESGKLPLAEE